MTIHDVAQAQFQHARGELQSIEIPEWVGDDGKPSKIYYYAQPNFGEYLKLAKHFRPDGSFDPELFYDVLTLFAREADGKAMWFTHSRLMLLERYDPRILMRVIGQMGVVERMSDTSIEGAKKS